MILDFDSVDPHLDISWVGGVAARRPRTNDINVIMYVYVYTQIMSLYTIYILKTW